MQVIVKEVGRPAELVDIDNDLHVLQEIVGGYIEAVSLSDGLVLICDEEGLIKGLPWNVNVSGQPFFGTIILAGAEGDEFADVMPAIEKADLAKVLLGPEWEPGRR